MRIEFRDAVAADAQALTNVRVRSKGHWGYSTETLAAWRPYMEVSTDYIASNLVQCVMVDGALAGFYAIHRGEYDLLDHLWLMPEAIGQGVGRAAMEDIAGKARAMHVMLLRIISDADAEGFYLRLGARKVDEFFSPVQNRMLPVLEWRIPAAAIIFP